MGSTLRAFNLGVEDVGTKLMLAVYVIVAWASKEPFPASTAFVVFGLCQVLRLSAFFFMSFSIEKAVVLYSSLLRVQVGFLFSIYFPFATLFISYP